MSYPSVIFQDKEHCLINFKIKENLLNNAKLSLNITSSNMIQQLLNSNWLLFLFTEFVFGIILTKEV